MTTAEAEKYLTPSDQEIFRRLIAKALRMKRERDKARMERRQEWMDGDPADN